MPLESHLGLWLQHLGVILNTFVAGDGYAPGPGQGLPLALFSGDGFDAQTLLRIVM